MNALREMLEADPLVTAPLVFNPVMAKLAERAGFSAAEAEEIQKHTFETIELAKLLDTERRTYDKP